MRGWGMILFERLALDNESFVVDEEVCLTPNTFRFVAGHLSKAEAGPGDWE